MVKSRFERKVLVSSDEEDEEKFSADETGTKVHTELFLLVLNDIFETCSRRPVRYFGMISQNWTVDGTQYTFHGNLL